MNFFLLFLSFEGTFTLPTIKQKTIEQSFFGVLPARSINFVWNPAFSFEVNKYWLEVFTGVEGRDFMVSKAYRGTFPMVTTNSFNLCGMIFLSEIRLSEEELNEHNRIELGISKKVRRVIWGVGVFGDRKDWWKVPPWREGWEYEVGVKGGIIVGGVSLAISITKDSQKERLEIREHFFYKWKNYGLCYLAEREGINFIGGYHTSKLKGGKFIKGVKIIPSNKLGRTLYSLLVGGEGNIGEVLTLSMGYVWHIWKSVTPTKIEENEDINLGITYQVGKFTTIINMETTFPFIEYFNTSNWDICISYGH